MKTFLLTLLSVPLLSSQACYHFFPSAFQTVVEEPVEVEIHTPKIEEAIGPLYRTWTTRAITKREKQYDWNQNGRLDRDELAALRQNQAQDRMVKDLRHYNEKAYERLLYEE